MCEKGMKIMLSKDKMSGLKCIVGVEMYRLSEDYV